MEQFTLYRNDNKNSKKAYPYFVDVQSDLLEELNSRIVIPLSSQKTLNNINAKNYALLLKLMRAHLYYLHIKSHLYRETH